MNLYQEASLIGVLRTIALVILIIYALRLITRLLLPFVLRQANRKMQNHFQQQQDRQQNGQTIRKDGNVTIEIKDPPRKREDSNAGDYVDFEEVKD